MLKPLLVTQLAKVTLSYPGFSEAYPNLNFDKLEMDFNPFIEYFKLRDNFCLLHWQAKPFGERRWGVYDSASDNYSSFEYSQLHLTVVPQLLQVNETLIKTVPTAVVLFQNSQLVKNGYYSINSL